MDLVVMAEWNRQYRESEMAKLDAQGRHRSEWCYAPYDERRRKVKWQSTK